MSSCHLLIDLLKETDKECLVFELIKKTKYEKNLSAKGGFELINDVLALYDFLCEEQRISFRIFPGEMAYFKFDRWDRMKLVFSDKIIKFWSVRNKWDDMLNFRCYLKEECSFEKFVAEVLWELIRNSISDEAREWYFSQHKDDFYTSYIKEVMDTFHCLENNTPTLSDLSVNSKNTVVDESLYCSEKYV